MSKARVVKLARDADPLMGAREASDCLGVAQSNLRELVGLPEPFQILAMGSVWLRQDIEQFAAYRAANPSRPGPKGKTQVRAHWRDGQYVEAHTRTAA